MSSLKKALLWAVSVIFVSATSYAGESGHVPISLYTHTFPHIAELKPAPDSFQLAKATFLPEASEDFDFSGASSNNNHNRGDNCDGYPFSACPTGGSCSPCPFNHRKLRVTGCQSPYLYQSGNCNCPAEKPLSCANDKCTQYCGSTCIAKSCSPTADQTNCTNGNQACDDGCCGTNRKCCVPCTDKITGKPSNSSYTYSSCTDGSGSHSIQTGWKCNSGYHQSGSSCEKDCIVQNCSGYTLSTCPAHGICSTCTKTAASCATDGTYKKLDSCETGYKISGNSCVEACTPRANDTGCSYGTKSCDNGCGGTRTCCCPKPISLPSYASCSQTCNGNCVSFYCQSGYVEDGDKCITGSAWCQKNGFTTSATNNWGNYSCPSGCMMCAWDTKLCRCN